MEEQRPIRPMSPSGPTPASGGEAAAQASKPPSLQTSDAGARSARVRSDLAREELETVKRTLRAVEAQANAAAPATTPASAPSGDYIRTTFRRAGASSTPAAWMVRSRVVEENGERKTVWELYSPLWSTGRTCAYAPGMASGWNRLSVTSGVLYAWRTWTGAKAGDAVTWTPGAVQLGNALGDIPADTEPTEATPGTRTTVVQVGFFVTGQGGAVTFTQEHLGVIVEGAPASGGAGVSMVPGPLTYVESDACFVRRMGTYAQDASTGAWVFTPATDASGQPLPPVESYPAIEVLHRDDSEYRNPKIRVALAADLGPTERNVAWLSKQEVEVAGGFNVSPPASDTDTGSVTGTQKTLTYFSYAAPTVTEDELLTVQVAEANDATAYEQP